MNVKSACNVFALCAAAVMLSDGAFADMVDLSAAKIVRAKNENPQQKVAADDLEKHLALIAGRKGDGDGIKFVFGRPSGEKSAAYCGFAKRKGNTIWFWGDDKGTKRYPYYGSAFAVYGFLEKFLGVKWVFPGDDGIVFKPCAKVDIPEDWTYEYKCRAETAMMRRAEPEYGRRMRYALKRPFKYGHAFRDWQKLYLKDHPEYLGLAIDGTRGVPEKHTGHEKLCLSNPEVIDVILANWQKKGGGKYLNLCPNDGTPGYCFCDGCLALDADKPGDPFYFHKTDRYLNFWNRVMPKALKLNPNVTAVSYIYSYYRFKPRRERIEFGDNMLFGMVPSMNDDYIDDFEGFKKAGLKHFFFRPNYLSYKGKLPRGLEKYIYDTFHFYHKEGSIGYDYDGAPSPVKGVEYYVAFRQVAFPEMSFEEIMDEWYSQYGEAAYAAVKEYYERIRARGDASRMRVAARMKAAKEDVLDDSELAGTVAEAHKLEDFVGDLAVLEKVDVSKLAPADARRFNALVEAAKGYVKVYPEVLEQSKISAVKAKAWEKEKLSVKVPVSVRK